MNTAYVVGGGLAGLAAAVALAEKGRKVVLIEGAPQAGGRCRSYFDATLGQVIDNGNHFVLSGNYAVMSYLTAIGSRGGLIGPEKSRTSFVDLATGRRWTIAPDEGPIPFWLFDAARRVPDTGPLDYLPLFKLLFARADETIGDVLPASGALWEGLLHPFFIGALNTEPKTASAALAGALVRETFAKGGHAYRIRVAHPTLAAVFVDPALDFLRARGVDIRIGQRARALRFDGDRLAALATPDGEIALAGGDLAILAVPPWVATELLPGVVAPTEFRSIVNAHFKAAPPPGLPPMLGVIGGLVQWIFPFADRISITVSGADAIVDDDREALAKRFWADVAKVLRLSCDMPPWQVVKERRATFAATPEQARLRSRPQTRWSNLLLAGDWTDTGLPSTIEGAVRSGQKAAALALPKLSV
ncbi:MAG: FAD-dependent oxidoreductase [Alphaproteobacteria bacterium]|nr:FAD-dependent oxidoreductase [Alphaproteobacteria bacterium]MBL7096495.1 FAD-dependent oxidoreductase [Alphaproteobacteria bacterium]